ncbi:MAG: RelA/SpoT family protein [Zhenhengia sp.]|uniref:GTP diphosphokinase n=1 Tax=Zhenhengia yiwuensis TaxID=2763666 RepID=A0A926EKL1_9FIRM|nr:bifunctional (p)ppGpp synthetase/guanosine-3',5'-bis(diphosphate) 3'-pyrophosphohydrolase [Zhenhengia yiwuensis]MBS5801044.1 bifunctional (p)ppGpp synthetase/guanosine-3',5'-bis(diphosphate) 3'-pyrophosphohydrolase [Clostridiales bacterium]MBC8581446.1 bifunctional (p)ppGpp synthetase/guanosine-3',5'-bis(diphosphate) 3'-pyrophosphohydrolase [Zhenhengia yiwuensis]MDU6358877.1 bifunctional (p)ppGpp synthetase/guanosine-3',5'-bis(diphosphate) 3'-pyrophosphohydrolase [Clostridiales bacterium]MDU
MPDEIYEKLINRIRSYHPSDDVSMVEKAYKLAKEAHEGQLRKSGEPYIIHPLQVAYILADLELDIESITAGILHDVVEDTDYTLEDIEKLFNKEVALLVDGVTKLGVIKYASANKELQKEEIQAENYRKMFLAMAQDIRVVLIKLADRLHNMQTLKFMPPHKQKRIAEETLTIYAPIAHRLGICKIKADLEDLSLRYIEPEVYYDLAQKIAKKRSERMAYIEQIVEQIKTKLEEAGIECTVEGRPKHFFSIYKKIVNKNKTLDQIYDLFAVRAIVHNVKDCYGVLGIIHELYTPIPGRFKDYIAMPKSNMYQSLHTTLMGSEGTPFEIQIRTEEMHRTAEYGIAAHWKYKDGNHTEAVGSAKAEEKLAWLKQILEWQRDMDDNTEFMNALKLDLDIYTDQVYVFTPKGELLTLPKGSTPIDYAYYIHSDIGNKMVGAKVNSKIVKVDYIIKNGDRVEILTSQNSRGPSRDWLNIVKSTQARNKINQWFRKQFKQEDIIRGKELLETCARQRGYSLSALSDSQCIENVYKRYGLKNWDAVCASIGYGSIKERQIIQRLIDENIKLKKMPITPQQILDAHSDKDGFVEEKQPKKSKSGIVVRGVGDVAVRFSKCCRPLPGDDIVGYITRGRGVSIHRQDCTNIVHMCEEEKERLIEAQWFNEEESHRTYITEIQITGSDRLGIIVDISKILTDMKVPVKSLNARTTKNHEAIFNIRIEITHTYQLDELTRKVMQIPDVVEIERVSS